MLAYDYSDLAACCGHLGAPGGSPLPGRHVIGAGVQPRQPEVSFRQNKDELVVAHALCAAGLWRGPFSGPVWSGHHRCVAPVVSATL